MHVRARLQAKTLRTVLLGVFSLFLYVLLFAFEERILLLSTQGSLAFLTPISIALVFSFVHGAFTSNFWDVLGVRPKTRREPRRWNR